MPVFKYLIFLLPLILTPSCKTHHQANSGKEILSFNVDDSITHLIEDVVSGLPDKTELAVAFTKGDSTSYYGAKNNEGQAIHINNHLTLFEIGSITKVFTSHLLAQAVQNGKITIDQPISHFIDFDLKDKSDITLKQLASHSSGLPGMPHYFFDPLVDSINPYQNYSEKIMLRDLESKIELDKESVDKWVYSNYGVSLLGYILARQNNSSFKELLQKDIISPFSLDYTSLGRSNLKSKLAMGMDSNGQQTSNWDLAAIAPAGGIISNVLDLSKYAIACYSKPNDVFSFQSTKVLNQPSKNADQALGWMIYKRKDGSPYCLLHSGQTGGYSSLILLQTDTKNSITILSNYSEEGNSILSLGFKLLKGLREGKYESKK